MNKFIQNTKLFFNKKPVRIVVALLIIAAIMTGVAFGVIALVNAFSDPCAKQPGTTWDKDLKVCVKDSCQMDNGEDGIVCKAKGKVNQCIAKDYCDYSGIEGQYSYDEESCMCKLDCSSLGKEFQGFTTDGRTEVSMQLQSDGTYKPQPDNILYCGSKCEYSKYSLNTNPQQDPNYGGTGWCAPNTLCGKSIDQFDNSFNEGMCFPINEFGFCSNSEIICQIDQSTSKVECVSTSEGERCIANYCGEKDNKVLICTSDTECYKSDKDKNKYECNMSTKELSHLDNIGYCTFKGSDIKSNNFYTTDFPNRCVDPKYVGQDHLGNAINCSYIKKPGINTKFKQCKNALSNGTFIMGPNKDESDLNVCAKYGICSLPENNWQAVPNLNAEDHCINSSSEYFKCSNFPCSLEEGYCCEKNKFIPGNFKKCCDEDTTKYPNCLNTTQKPYDSSFLDPKRGKLGEPKSLDKKFTPQEIEEYTKTLQNVLVPQSSEDIKKYVKVIQKQNLEDNRWYLYGQCGSLVHDDPIKYKIESTPLSSSQFSNKTEVCVPTSTCTQDPPAFENGELFSGLPYCFSNFGTSSQEAFWSSNQPSLKTTMTQTFSNKGNPCVPGKFITDTLKNTSGVIDMRSKNGTDFNSVIYDINCDNLNIQLEKNDGRTQITKPWKSLINGEEWKDINYNKYFKNRKMGGSNKPVYIAQTNPWKTGPGGAVSNAPCSGDPHGFPEGMTFPGTTWQPLKGVENKCVGSADTTNIDLVTYDGKVCKSNIDLQTGDCI